MIDSTSLGWYKQLAKSCKGARRTIAIPQKYFDILLTWGYVSGSPGEARLGLTLPPKALLEEGTRSDKTTKSNKRAGRRAH